MESGRNSSCLLVILMIVASLVLLWQGCAKARELIGGYMDATYQRIEKAEPGAAPADGGKNGKTEIARY